MKARSYTIDDAQADRRKLAALLDQTIDAMPEDSDPAQYPVIAKVLLGETLASAKRQGLMPVSLQVQTLAACRSALGAVSYCSSLAQFQEAAKAALKTALDG